MEDNFGNQQYISLFEAAKVLNTSRDYVNVLVRRKKLEAVKLGRNWVTCR
ncbi:MAG: excisionase family DNA-binding protein [Parcubacteria group bacterium]|nr:excisionase family DNA-binding protein [Parcubacteria group bacterium]